MQLRIVIDDRWVFGERVRLLRVAVALLLWKKVIRFNWSSREFSVLVELNCC